MCKVNPALVVCFSELSAEDRDAMREFAHKRRDKAITPHAREFWDSIAAMCCHPKPVTGEVG